jgi:hypothetical protein
MDRALTREMQFAVGLSKLAASCRQELDDLTVEVYTEALSPLVDPDEWDEFVLSAIRAGRFGAFKFPATAELLDALREFRGAPTLEGEAAQAYDRVLASGTRRPDGEGTYWDHRRIVEACGPAAREAFLAAGGHNAFATTWNEAKRRDQFIAAYLRAARDEPATRLLPAGDQPKQLPSGAELVTASIDQAKAREVVRRLRELAGLGPEEPERPKAGVVVASPDRLRLLRAQAEQLKAESEATVEP